MSAFTWTDADVRQALGLRTDLADHVLDYTVSDSSIIQLGVDISAFLYQAYPG